MKRRAEADYRRQLEEERQRAIEESHWVLDGKEKEDRSGLIKWHALFYFQLLLYIIISCKILSFSSAFPIRLGLMQHVSQ